MLLEAEEREERRRRERERREEGGRGSWVERTEERRGVIASDVFKIAENEVRADEGGHWGK